MKPDQIARIINLDTSSVQLAINAEKMNIEKTITVNISEEELKKIAKNLNIKVIKKRF